MANSPHLPYVPDEKAVREISQIREAAIHFDELLDKVIHPRYKALAKTELERVVMWAVKGHTVPPE